MNKAETYHFVCELSMRVLDKNRTPKGRFLNWEDDECPSLMFDGEDHEIHSVRYEYKKDICYFRLMFNTVCVRNFSKVLNKNMEFPMKNVRLWTKKRGHYATNTNVQLEGMEWFFDEDMSIMDVAFANEF